MKTDRPALESAGGLRRGWNRFWFAPVPAMQLHRLRVLAGLLILAWMLGFAGYYRELFSLQGWFDREAYLEVSRKAAETPEFAPPAPIGWSIFYLADGASALFDALYWGSAAVVLLFTLGVAPRLTGILTWVIVVSLTANPATSYDADFLIAILAFYLMLGYVFLGLWGGRHSVVERIIGPTDSLIFSWFGRKSDRASAPSYAANLAVRMFQVHFAIILVTSAISKLQVPDWWAGVAYWYPLHPPFQTTKDSYMRGQPGATSLLVFLSLAQYTALAWQIGFATFAWRRGLWRVVLVGGGVIAWLSCFFLMGLPLFGPFILIGCLSYLDADEWHTLLGGLRGSERPRAKALAGPSNAMKVKVGSA